VAVAEPLTRDKSSKAIRTVPTVWELSPSETNVKEGEVAISTVTAEKKHGKHQAAAGGPIECLTYRDPFSYVYKK
jgi:nitrite reductase (NAD(P)H)